jgi:hypothetical protein
VLKNDNVPADVFFNIKDIDYVIGLFRNDYRHLATLPHDKS